MASLLDLADNPNGSSETGFPFLHQAILDGLDDQVAWLLERGASLSQKGPLGFTARQLAQAVGQAEVLPTRRIKVGRLDSDAVDLLTVAEFEEWTGVRYAPFLIARDFKTLCFAAHCCRRGERKGHFDAQRQWLGRWHHRELETAQVNAGVVKWIDPSLGYGLFAERDMAPFEYVGAYTGQLIRRDFFLLHTNDYCFRYPTGVETMRPLLIDAETMGNELRYANHSDTPNMEGIGVLHGPLAQVIFRTSRLVHKGEQLTYDYGTDFWHHRDTKRRTL